MAVSTAIQRIIESAQYINEANVTPLTFLILNLGVGFYNVGTVWANEIDIFRSWKLLDQKDFERVRQAHWKKLPYWVLFPWGLAIAGSTCTHLVSSRGVARLGDLRRKWMLMVVPHSHDIHVGSVAEEINSRPIGL